MELNQQVLKQLEAPFDPEDVKWRPGATYTKEGKKSAIGLAYADSRHYFSRLSDCVGGEWSDHYDIQHTADRVFITCSLTVCGVTRTDVGEEPLMVEQWKQGGNVIVENSNALTTAAAQAFKRACVKFGLGAYFYNMPTLWGEIDNRKRFVDQAERHFDQSLRSWMKANYDYDAPARKENVPSEAEEPEPPAKSNGAFASPQAAIAWAMDQGAFDNKPHANNAYNKLKDERQPTTADEMAELWRADVFRRLEEE